LNEAGRSAAPQEIDMARILKWIGSITAILSLVFGVYQLATMISDARERARHIDEVFAIAKAQQGAADYAAAWESFGEALKSAEEGGTIAKIAGQLDSRQLRIREAQEDLAMEWLRNIRTASDEKFSDTVDKLLPVLVRGVPDAGGARKGDLTAHIGWSYFLKSRDGMIEADPERSYAQALAADSANPYAHAYWGHWILWKRGSLDEAMQHFAAAVAANRELAYVRRIELAALTDARSGAGDAEFLRVVNEMRKRHEPLDARVRGRVYSIYYVAMQDDPQFKKLTAAVPATEHIDLIRALLNDASFDASKIPLREAAIAVLQEAAGQRERALASWKTVRAAVKPGGGEKLRQRADAEIKRLSR